MASWFQIETPFSKALEERWETERAWEQDDGGEDDAAVLSSRLSDLRVEAIRLAKDVTAEELAREKYIDFLLDRDWIFRDGSGDFEEVLVAWAQTGVLLRDAGALARDIPGRLAWSRPFDCASLESNPEWWLATCEPRFNGLAGVGRFWAQVDPPKDHKEARALIKSWPRMARFRHAMNNGWMEWPIQKAAQQLLDAADERGRLDMLRQSGRAEAWLMHCLAFAPFHRVQKALGAGMTLSAATQQDVLKFFDAMKTVRPTALEREEWPNGLFYFASTDEAGLAARKRWQAAGDEAAVDLWRRWETAIQAGLPRVDWKAQGQSADGAHAQEDSPLPLAILAQEALREGEFNETLATLWIRASATTPWFDSLARLAGAKEGESAMDWAFRHGLKAKWITPARLNHALSQRTRSSALEESLDAMAQAGVRLSRPDRGADGLALGIFMSAQNPERAAAALGRMKIHWGWKSPENANLPHALMARHKERAMIAAMEQADLARPGQAKELMEPFDDVSGSALHWAARAFDFGFEPLDFCFKKGMDLNARDAEGKTLFAWAMRRGMRRAREKTCALIDWLDARGFDWLAVDPAGQTPLIQLAEKGNFDAIKKLIELAPASAGAKDKAGRSWVDAVAARRERDPQLFAQAEAFALELDLRARNEAAKASPGSDDPLDRPNRQPRRI